MKFGLLLILVTAAFAIFPQPQKIVQGSDVLTIDEPCQVVVSLMSEYLHNDVISMTKEYLGMFKECRFERNIFHQQTFLQGDANIRVEAYIEDINQSYELDAKLEFYQLDVTSDGLIKIQTPTYVGYLRAMDTLSQIIIEKDGQYLIEGVPLHIQDQPYFAYRGFMIDTARHYMSVSTIKRTIDSLVMNKMNVLHWHITDDESFPLLLKDLVQIPQHGAYSAKHTFTYEDVKDIIAYAKKKGVQVVPELDTPGHVFSWGHSDDLKDIVIPCQIQYGQFDPTLEKTYAVVESVFREIATLFVDSPFVHFGGDEVEASCYDKRPQIKEFMAKNNISDYEGLQTYYRERQKRIWRDVVKSNKAVAYWTNKEINLPVQEDDIVHWWGTTPELSEISDKKNKIVLSNYDLLYLDTGFNNAFGDHYGQFHTWKEIYQRFDPLPKNIQGTVIGGEVCLWAETNSEASHFLKMYTRTSAFAERIWNPTQIANETLASFTKRLIQMENRLLSSGFPVLAVSSQYCTLNVDKCFG